MFKKKEIRNFFGTALATIYSTNGSPNLGKLRFTCSHYSRSRLGIEAGAQRSPTACHGDISSHMILINSSGAGYIGFSASLPLQDKDVPNHRWSEWDNKIIQVELHDLVLHADYDVSLICRSSGHDNLLKIK